MILLTKLRAERGWSKNALAQRALMHASDVGKIEAGRLRPYDVQLKRLARALGVPVKDAATLLQEEAEDGLAVTVAKKRRRAPKAAPSAIGARPTC